MTKKNQIEIINLLILILGLCILDRGSFILIVIYANFLRLKYILNERSKKAWS
jgi:hypothetical protein